MRQHNLTVGLDNRAYDIIIAPNLIERAGDVLGKITADRHVIIISDTTVAALHLDRLETGLKAHARKINHFAVAAGEASKSMSVLSRLLDDILAIGIDRSALIIAFGGGVVGDLAGFAAASLLSGRHAG